VIELPTWKQVEKRFGKKIAAELKTSQYLDGITMTILPSGEFDIPERDIDLAIRDITGQYIHPEEWD
jgi:hypothetical protein